MCANEEMIRLSCREIRSAEDMAAAYGIYRSNPDYFRLTAGRLPELADVAADREALPEGLDPGQKRFLLYCLDGVPVAVLDLLAGFPRADTLHIGLLLVDGTRRRQGIGKLLVTALARQAEAEGFRRLRLGVVAGNCGGRAFWTAMGFHTVDTVESCPAPDRRWTVEIMERPL